jgi:uncharacterized protein
MSAPGEVADTVGIDEPLVESVVEASVVREGETFSRVALTAEALDLLRGLWADNGPLMFHQSGGCCDGSSPMCYPEGDFLTSDADVLLGVLDIAAAGEEPRPIEFWMSVEQFEYWKHTHLTVDAVPGRGGGFSLESPLGKRFLIRSRLMEV